MKRGLVFEQLVCEELAGLNVPVTPTAGTEADARERVDCFVQPTWTDQLVGIQLTLRSGVLEKLRGFVETAIGSIGRGPRLYVEIIAPYQRDMREVACRTAWAIKAAVRDFRDYGSHNMLGLRLRPGRCKKHPRFEKFVLEEAVGIDWFHNLLLDRAMAEINAIIADPPRTSTPKTPWPLWTFIQSASAFLIALLRQGPSLFRPKPQWDWDLVPAHGFMPVSRPPPARRGTYYRYRR